MRATVPNLKGGMAWALFRVCYDAGLEYYDPERLAARFTALTFGWDWFTGLNRERHGFRRNVSEDPRMPQWERFEVTLQLDADGHPEAELVTHSDHPYFEALVEKAKALWATERQIAALSTVTDVASGLMWMRPLLGQTIDADGNVVGEPQKMTFDDAAAAAVHADFAGHKDWRVPSSEELKTLLVAGEGADVKRIDERVFGCGNRYLWSSTLGISLGPSRSALILPVAGSGDVGICDCGTTLQVRLVRNVA